MSTKHAAEPAAILSELTEVFRLVLEDPDIELALATTPDDLPCWDSMNHIAIVVEAECRFDIEFQVREIEDLTSVEQLVRMIETKRSRWPVRAGEQSPAARGAAEYAERRTIGMVE